MIYECDEYQITLVQRLDNIDEFNNYLIADTALGDNTQPMNNWVITVQRLPLDSYPETSELHLSFSIIDPTVNATVFLNQALPEINTWIENMDATAHLENTFVPASNANLTVMFSS